MNGWTQSLPASIQRHNEIKTLIGLCLAHPSNRYWRARLLAVLFS